MEAQIFWAFLGISIVFLHFTLGQINSEGNTTAAAVGCFTPDYTQGLCVPIVNCRRIEWMLENWSPPYPAHISRYVRQSHCGTLGEVHYACCAFYDIKGHQFHTHRPPQLPKPSPSPSFIRNPQQTFHQHRSWNQPAPLLYDPKPSDLEEEPKVDFLQTSVGERILRATPCGQHNGDRISNGEVVRLSEFPWMVLLESDGVKARKRFRCAGTLISHQYVLTAAHCVEDSNDVISVRLGEHDLSTSEDCEEQHKSRRHANCAPPHEDVGIEAIIRHPNYKLHPLESDIALIRLQRPVIFNTHIKAICLPLDPYNLQEMPTYQFVAGWGVTEQGYASDVLLKARVPLQNFEFCQNLFRRNRMSASEHLCAGGEDRRSTCRADSGGPLFGAVPNQQRQMRYMQFGITSAGGYSCGSQYNLPGIYTNVGNYISWIKSTIY